MKGVRFYLDHDSPRDKRRGNHDGNVTAVFTDNGFCGTSGYCYEAVGAIYYRPNSPVCGTSVSLDWLHNNGKRISEKEAREIHPALFERLDND